MLTVMVTELVTGVPPLLAVAVYVVVTGGFTGCEPLRATVPIPLSMATDVAFVDLHVRAEEPPTVIDKGVADREMVGAAGGGVDVTVTVTELFAVAVPLVAVAV